MSTCPTLQQTSRYHRSTPPHSVFPTLPVVAALAFFFFFFLNLVSRENLHPQARPIPSSLESGTPPPGESLEDRRRYDQRTRVLLTVPRSMLLGTAGAPLASHWCCRMQFHAALDTPMVPLYTGFPPLVSHHWYPTTSGSAVHWYPTTGVPLVLPDAVPRCTLVCGFSAVQCGRTTLYNACCVLRPSIECRQCGQCLKKEHV